MLPSDNHTIIFLFLVVGCVIGLAFSLWSWVKDPDTKHEFMNRDEYY